jgi:hypothetical protein
LVAAPVAAEETDADGGSGGLRPGTIAPEHEMPTSIYRMCVSCPVGSGAFGDAAFVHNRARSGLAESEADKKEGFYMFMILTGNVGGGYGESDWTLEDPQGG